MNLQLDKQVTLITGAAGRIGFAVAQLLHSRGSFLVLADINISILDDLCKSCKFIKEQYLLISADVSNQEGIQGLMHEIHLRGLRIHSAVHCAYPRSNDWGARFEDLCEASLSDNLSMQLGGAILFSREIIAHFKSYGGGNLVHISSIQGVSAPKFEHYEGTKMSSPIEYSAIKSGVISITRWLAKYCKDMEIRVNCVSPGGIEDEQPEKFLVAYRKSCSNFGLLSAHQVAGSVEFLLSPQAAAINGHNIIVDDGWSL